MKLVITFAFLIIIKERCNAQFTPAAVYSGYLAAGTYSRNFTDVFSGINNQSCLSQVHEPAAGVCSERRYMLKELGAFTGAFAFPFKAGAVGISAHYSGYEDYNQAAIGLAYGRALGKKADLGIQFNYNRVSITGYGNAAAWCFEAGTMFHLTEKLHMGFHLYNPLELGKFSGSGEKLPSIYTFGYGYEVSDKILISGEVIKESLQPAIGRFALLYAVDKAFIIKAGVSAGVGAGFLGAGLNRRNIRLDLCASWHQQLGITPAILLVFSFKRNPEDPE